MTETTTTEPCEIPTVELVADTGEAADDDTPFEKAVADAARGGTPAPLADPDEQQLVEDLTPWLPALKEAAGEAAGGYVDCAIPAAAADVAPSLGKPGSNLGVADPGPAAASPGTREAPTSAADLPPGSVIASDTQAFVKTTDERYSWQCGGETWGNDYADAELAAGRVKVLRVGTGAASPGTADGDSHAWMDEPTDSESPDAQHNPDVFELRRRITLLRYATASGTIVLGVGPEGCQPGEWDCEDYFDADGNQLPDVKRCGHITDDVWDADRLVALIESADGLVAKFNMLTAQSCTAGKHADWLVEGPDHHPCPWCALAARDGEVRQLRDQLAASVVPDDLRGDGPCHDCETRDNIVWFTESVLWNEVIRQGDYVEPILCVPCFIKRVDVRGLRPTGWRLIPDWHWETKAEFTARRAGTS